MNVQVLFSLGLTRSIANPDHPQHQAIRRHLRDESACSGALVPPGGREDTDGLVVAGQTVDARLDENEAELAVLVLAVALKVLADGDGLSQLLALQFQHPPKQGAYLLDQEVKVLWQFGSEACKSLCQPDDQAEA